MFFFSIFLNAGLRVEVYSISEYGKYFKSTGREFSFNHRFKKINKTPIFLFDVTTISLRKSKA